MGAEGRKEKETTREILRNAPKKENWRDRFGRDCARWQEGKSEAVEIFREGKKEE